MVLHRNILEKHCEEARKKAGGRTLLHTRKLNIGMYVG